MICNEALLSFLIFGAKRKRLVLVKRESFLAMKHLGSFTFRYRQTQTRFKMCLWTNLAYESKALDFFVYHRTSNEVPTQINNTHQSFR